MTELCYQLPDDATSRADFDRLFLELEQTHNEHGISSFGISDTSLEEVSIKCFKPFPKQQILDSSKLKEFADNKFKFDKDGRKFSKWVENTAGKGEIACYEQFLLFPQWFQKNSTTDT